MKDEADELHDYYKQLKSWEADKFSAGWCKFSALADKQYEAAVEYANQNKAYLDESASLLSKRERERLSTTWDTTDLNSMLVNWVELKYDSIWSTDLCKEKKWELKQQNIFFRIVKQGSVLTYLTFHIFLIFLIFVTATLRRSVLALVYVLLLLPRVSQGSEVLRQREINRAKGEAAQRQRIAQIVAALRRKESEE